MINLTKVRAAREHEKRALESPPEPEDGTPEFWERFRGKIVWTQGPRDELKFIALRYGLTVRAEVERAS